MISNASAGPLSAMGARQLIETMRAFRARTLALIDDLSDKQLIGPRIPTVNPPLWEIGHVAWFAEFWLLRHLKKQKPLLGNGDELYNSSEVAHDTRWELLLPPREKTLEYMDRVLERCIEVIDVPRQLSADEFYFGLLTTFHEGMHAEALAYTRQTLAYPAPKLEIASHRSETRAGLCPGDVEIPGGSFLIGATEDSPFVFDNEKWAHAVNVNSFQIARAPVTNREFLGFVEDAGYRERRFWSDEGWQWLTTGGAPQLERSFAKFFNKELHEETDRPEFQSRLDHPIYWRRDDNGRWLQRIYDHYLSLADDLPVVHVSWYEAEAYCNWAGRRMPTEVEWEITASMDPGAAGANGTRRYFPWGNTIATRALANLDWHAGGPIEVGALGAGDSAFGCRQMIGNVWEWTASEFQPYPGFSPDPYKEYSQPWFGTHKVLRGGCWATSSLLIRNTWRNFYTPDRRDVWAGFRTCAR
jgi:gamma-glutamyl hercynylcysteine S-oxide synthase